MYGISEKMEQSANRMVQCGINFPSSSSGGLNLHNKSKRKMAHSRITFAILLVSLTGFGQNPFSTVQQQGGPTLGYSTSSGIQLIKKDGLSFKDLNKNGKLDTYEDWRLSAEERAKDLALKLTIDQIAGLMLYSPHQSIPGRDAGFGKGTYSGKTLKESGAKSSDLSDEQKGFLTKDHLRHVLITTVESPEVAATWNNNVQAFVEGIDLGIPVNTSSDPRHTAVASTEYNAGSGGRISMWPEALGLGSHL